MKWHDNYLQGIRNAIDSAILQGDTDAVEMLEKLYRKVSRMSPDEYLLGQLVNPGELAIQYYYRAKGERGSEQAKRVESIIRAWSDLVG